MYCHASLLIAVSQLVEGEYSWVNYYYFILYVKVDRFLNVPVKKGGNLERSENHMK